MISTYLFELGKSIALVLLVIFFAFGGFSGIASLVTWRWKSKFEADMKADFDRKLEAFKAEQNEKVQKVIESHKAELQKEADELSQTLSEKITRRSKAFDLQLNKEYEFYEKFGLCLEKLLISFRELEKSLNNENGNENPDNEFLLEKYEVFTLAFFELEGLTISHTIYLDISLIECFFRNKSSADSYCKFIVDSMLKIHKKEKVENLKETLEKLGTAFTHSLGETSDMINKKMKDAIHTN